MSGISNVKKIVVIVCSIVVAAIIIAFISKDLNLRSTKSKVKEREKEVIDVITSNPDILDLLEGALYSYEDEVRISYKGSEIEFLVNGNVEALDEKSVETLTSLFEALDFNRIYFSEDNLGKMLVLKLGNIVISKNNVYVHSLIYCKNGNEELGDEVLQNWYYKVMFYT